MRYMLLALLLGGCAAPSIVPPQTVTITKIVPVYPPDNLYSEKSGCTRPPKVTAGTVRDALNSSIAKDAAITTCLGDRAALRQWELNSKAGSK
jgi:hypothetical protein